MKRVATCTCGQLSITVGGEPRGVGLCHCLACQSRTGSAFAYLASFAAPYTVSGRASEYSRSGDQGATFRFRFCPTCGTNLYHTEEGTTGPVSVAAGAFGDPDFPPPEMSVYEIRRHGWVALPSPIKAFPKDPC